MKKIFKSTVPLSTDELLTAMGLSSDNSAQIKKYDYYDAALDNFMEYKHTLYEVIIN